MGCPQVSFVDKERPEVQRCQCVGKDFRTLQPSQRDLFTTSSLPITNRIVDAESHGWARLVADATNACFHVAEDEDMSLWWLAVTAIGPGIVKAESQRRAE